MTSLEAIHGVESQYFLWLTVQIEVEQPNRNRFRSYNGLFHILYRREFSWTVPHDENRIGDAQELRIEFLNLEGIEYTFQDAVSVLEIIIALSRRLEFNGEGEAKVWAWQLIKNLGLHKMYDPMTYRKEEQINDILETLIWRTYRASGSGGFFPLQNPHDDQREIEIWYQMNAYIMEIRD